MTKINGVTITGGGSSASRLSEVTAVVAHATGDADAGLATSIDLGANYGVVSRIRIYSPTIMGQQSSWSALVNTGATSGITAAATALPFDNATGAVGPNDYIKIDDEIIFVNSGTSTPLTIARAKKGTVAAYHDDNAQCIKLNDGLRVHLYPSSSRVKEDQLFEWNGIMTGMWQTDAAIGTSNVIDLSSSPAVLSDFGYGDIIMIDDAADEWAMVQTVYGDVAVAANDNTIVTLDTLTAHNSGTYVYRVPQFDVPLPFKFSNTSGILNMTLFVDEKITTAVTATIQMLVDKYS